eukprot:513751_1
MNTQIQYERVIEKYGLSNNMNQIEDSTTQKALNNGCGIGLIFYRHFCWNKSHGFASNIMHELIASPNAFKLTQKALNNEKETKDISPRHHTINRIISKTRSFTSNAPQQTMNCVRNTTRMSRQKDGGATKGIKTKKRLQIKDQIPIEI